MRTVWVSFDVIGLDCLEVAAASGADIIGVVTLPGPVDPNRSGQCSFGEVAQRLGATLIETAEVNAPETVAAVAALQPDVTFVVGWSQLVREAFLAVGGMVYGMHPTLLPRHRGRAPIPWAIISGLAKTGVTLFEITDPTADSGPIVGQVEIPIAPDETATSLFDKTATAHMELVRDIVPLIAAGSAPRLPQDVRRASTWQKRTPLDGIIDWETRAPYLDAWIRAQTRPYPGAFTWLGDDKIVVWKAVSVEASAAPAGTVVEQRAGGPVVACGDGALLLEEVETRGELEIGAVLG